MAYQFLIIYYDSEPKLWDVYGNIVEPYDISNMSNMSNMRTNFGEKHTDYNAHRQLFVHYFSFPPKYFMSENDKSVSLRNVVSKLGLKFTPPPICNPSIIRQMASYLDQLRQCEEDDQRVSFSQLIEVITNRMQNKVIEPRLLWQLAQCILDVSEFDWIYAQKSVKGWLTQIRVKF